MAGEEGEGGIFLYTVHVYYTYSQAPYPTCYVYCSFRFEQSRLEKLPPSCFGALPRNGVTVWVCVCNSTTHTSDQTKFLF